jgi:hypothetical protein
MLPVFILTLLIGCTDQSQLAGPTSTPSITTMAKPAGNIFESEKFETMVVGPGGVKFLIAGSVDYALSVGGSDYALWTRANATISQSGNANSWDFTSENNFKSTFDEKGIGVSSESTVFAYTKKLPLYRLNLEYTIEGGNMKVTNIRVLDARADIATKVE